MTVIKESSCRDCSALSTAGGRNPGALGLHCLFIVELLSIQSFGAQSKLYWSQWKESQKLCWAWIRHFVYFINRVSMQMEIAVGSQKTVHSAEEDMKIEGTGMMVREKDCTLDKLLQVYRYLSSFLDVQAALIATIQQCNFSTHRISSESADYALRTTLFFLFSSLLCRGRNRRF